jgi:hypothetical protein
MALEPVHDVKHSRDGFPQGVAVALGILAAICLAFFAVAVFGGFP